MLGVLIQRLNDDGTLASSGMEKEFLLPVSEISISHRRVPIVSTLPDTEPIMLDLGQWSVEIKMEGTVNRTSMAQLFQDVGGDDIKIVNREYLEQIASSVVGDDWHADKIRITDLSDSTTTGMDIGNPKYEIKISNLTLVTAGSWEYFNYVLQGMGYRENL